MSWPTGDNVSGQQVVVRFLVPNDEWIIQSLTGAIISMMSEFSWDPVGVITPAVAARIFQSIYFGVAVQPITVGAIWWFPNNNMQFVNQDPAQGASQFLHADGSDVSVVSYPELYAVVGNLYGGDTTHFFLPDLRSVTMVGAGAQGSFDNQTLGSVLGENSHTLTTTEMPAHDHGYTDQVITPVVAAPGVVPVTADAPIPNLTSIAGGSVAHNNMQPSAVLVPYIQAFP